MRKQMCVCVRCVCVCGLLAACCHEENSVLCENLIQRHRGFMTTADWREVMKNVVNRRDSLKCV